MGHFFDRIHHVLNVENDNSNCLGLSLYLTEVISEEKFIDCPYFRDLERVLLKNDFVKVKKPHIGSLALWGLYGDEFIEYVEENGGDKEDFMSNKLYVLHAGVVIDIDFQNIVMTRFGFLSGVKLDTINEDLTCVKFPELNFLGFYHNSSLVQDNKNI